MRNIGIVDQAAWCDVTTSVNRPRNAAFDRSEQMLPTITIITPSYNQGDFLEEAICSVLSQNYARLQYMIIDGGSTDCSRDVIGRYSSKLDYWISEKDRGQSD